MFERSSTPMTIFHSPLTVIAVISHVFTAPYQTARGNEIARLQPGLLGRGSARDRADLWRELRPHSELPRFFRLAEDRIAHGDEAWCHRDGLLGTTPLDGELERSAAGRGDELVHVLPVADRPAIDGDDQITRLESRLGRGRSEERR